MEVVLQVDEEDEDREAALLNDISTALQMAGIRILPGQYRVRIERMKPCSRPTWRQGQQQRIKHGNKIT